MSLKVNHTMSRREAMAAMGAIAAAGSASLAFAQAAPKPAKFALQLYTMREPAKKDLADTLKKVRAIGFEYVQWSGMPDLPADKIRAALDEAGLKAMAAHVGFEPFETDFENQVKFWKTVGVEAVGPGGMMKDNQASAKAWLEGAKRFDAVGAKLRGAGLRLTYHNHASELEKFQGEAKCKLDMLYGATDPKNLSAELDLAWLVVGGADPAAYIKQCKGRVQQVHAKDVIEPKKGNPVQFTPLGQGCLNWDAILAAGKEAGTEWYIYEQDNGKGSPFDWAAESYAFMTKKLAGK